MEAWASLRDISIARKLRYAMVATSAAALLLGTGAFVAYDWLTMRSQMVRELESISGIVSANTTAALVFQDTASAHEVLDALSARPPIRMACLYHGPSGNRDLFAAYTPAGAIAACPEAPAGDGGFLFVAGGLQVARSIVLEGETIGFLYVEQDLELLWARLRLYTSSVPMVLALCLLMAYGISALLERIITEPLVELADTTRRISESKDYSIRLPSSGGDEVGQLIDGFNAMVGEIEARDREIRKAHDELEVRVEQRTKELRVENAERKRAEEALQVKAGELKNANVHLTESNLELQQFVYITTHDLQEPLRSVASFAQLLQRRYEGQLDDKADEWIEFLVSGAKRMKALVQDVLEYSRLEPNAKPFQPVDTRSVVNNALLNLDAAINELGAEVTYDPLPTVMGDASQLVQLVQNLIGNAIKFHGDAAPRVHIGVTRDGERWEFAVRDNGIGIKPEYRERIFQIFKRLHTQAHYTGTGIGLAICKKVVERHGGTLNVTSADGGGSVFSFSLPAGTGAIASSSGPQDPQTLHS